MIDYDPIKAYSYIPLDKKLANKKAIINIQNEDNECFKWCITRALNPKENHPERVDKDLREQSKKLNWYKIDFPVSLDQIMRFEKNNLDISVNVFGYSKNEKVYQLHVSSACLEKRKHVINLLLISNEEKKHYCLIKDLRSLLSSQTSKHHTHYCMNCLLGFDSEESLSKHQLYCFTHKLVRIELPVEGVKIQFSNYNRSMRVPFVIMQTLKVLLSPSVRVHLIKTNPIQINIKNILRVHSVITLNVLMKVFTKVN